MTDGGPGWDFFCTELYYETALLEQEIRAADDAARSGGQDETSDSLREYAKGLLIKMLDNAATYRKDPARTSRFLVRTAAITSLDRMLTSSAGFRLTTIDVPVPHLRIHARPDADTAESFDLWLLDVKGLAAVPGHVSVTDHDPVAVGHDFPTAAFDHAGYLLIQQIQNAHPEALLVQQARKMLKDQANDPDAYRAEPFRTKARLLRIAALVGADRMLSHPDGMIHQPGGRGRSTRISLPEDRHPPEMLEVTLPPVPEP